MFKNNIIDLNQFIQKSKTHKKDHAGAVSMRAPVVDMTERREAILSEERREVKRTILTGFVGAYLVIPSRADGTGGLLKVDIHDISENGVAFDMESEQGQFKIGEEVAMRVYLSQDTYFGFIITIQNVRQIDSQEINRHGAHFNKGTLNDQALHHFVKFIETVSASLETDSGDVMVSGLKK